MNQVDHSLVEEMNIQTDAIIANQSNEFSHQRFNHAGNTIDFYSFNERGVGLNRNNAFMRATAEICLLADDDIQYYHGYPSLIAKQFDERPDADVVIFNLDEESGTRFQITEPVRVGFTNFMRFGAPRVAFRRKSVFLQGVLFNLSFGGGTEISAGEDALFLRECLRKGLRIWAVPVTIGRLEESRDSSWFQGYNDKYFIDRGKLFAVMDPYLAPLLGLQFCLRHRGMFRGEMPLARALRLTLQGVKAVRAHQ